MHTLHVDLGERSYPVYIGRDLFVDDKLLAQHVAGRVFRLHLGQASRPSQKYYCSLGC